MNCTICQGADTMRLEKRIRGSSSAKLFYCSTCDHAFLADVDLPADFYESEFNSYMQERSTDNSWASAERHLASRVPEAQEHLRRLMSLVDFHHFASILDVGSSSGALLEALGSTFPNLRIAGVEPGTGFRQFAVAHGRQVYASVDEVDSTYDCIIAIFVLEHIIHPFQWLQQLRKLLIGGGIMILVVPNVKEALLSAYEDSHYDQFVWQAPHLSYFSEHSLTCLLNRISPHCRIHQYQRYPLSNHLNWLSGLKPARTKNYNHINDELDRQYRTALEAHGIADTLVGVIYSP